MHCAPKKPLGTQKWPGHSSVSELGAGPEPRRNGSAALGKASGPQLRKQETSSAFRLLKQPELSAPCTKHECEMLGTLRRAPAARASCCRKGTAVLGSSALLEAAPRGGMLAPPATSSEHSTTGTAEPWPAPAPAACSSPACPPDPPREKPPGAGIWLCHAVTVLYTAVPSARHPT